MGLCLGVCGVYWASWKGRKETSWVPGARNVSARDSAKKPGITDLQGSRDTTVRGQTIGHKVSTSLPTATTRPSSGGKQESLEHSRSPWEICKRDVTQDLHGSFRELDCWITIRRNAQIHGHDLDRMIRQRFRQLFQTLQTMPNDEFAPERWRLLYVLGTRLYPMQNQWAVHSTIPVYEVNGHNLAFPLWFKEGQRRKLGTLVHFDSHDDMVGIPRPEQVQQAIGDLRKQRNIRQAWHTIAHTVSDCSMPVTAAFMANLYNDVIWAKNKDVSTFPEFTGRTFFFGMTFPKVPEMCVQTGISTELREEQEEQKEDVAERKRRFRLYYDPQLNDKKPPLAWNDSWIWVDAQQRPHREKFMMYKPFQFSILNMDGTIDRQGKGQGEKNLQRFLTMLPPGRFTLDLDLDYFASVDVSKGFDRKSGCAPENRFKKLQDRRKILRERLAVFRNLLLVLRSKGRIPAIITIADSTFLGFALDPEAEAQDEYTPIEHAAFLRRHVRKIFREVYGKQVTDGEPKPLQSMYTETQIP